jgi:O-methyltransferase involved in polyketide biosynthesis
VKAELGEVQQTLFIPLADRARHAHRKRPVLRDPKAAEILASVDFDMSRFGRGWGSDITVLRTAIFDGWVRDFLAARPGGTVVELGTGLNSRFERVGRAEAHWIDLDLPDTIELRRRFFADTGHRRMLAASVLEEDWIREVRGCPAPYFFAAEGVLPYLAQAPAVIARLASSFPGALIAFDTYRQRTLEQQHKLAARKGIARWAWSCDDPRTLESARLRLVQQAAVTRPPAQLLSQLPRTYRYALRLARRIVGDLATVTLFRAAPS